MTWIRQSRTLAVALLVALALNLFLGSVIAGHWMQGGQRSWSATSIVERRAERLPATDAEVLRAAFEARSTDLEASFDALRDAREQARAAAGAEPFDAEALAGALAEVRARTHHLHEGFHELYLEVAPQMSAEGRRALFERRHAGRA